MISVILAGGGRGRRIGNTSKAFIKIGGKELIYHSLDRFHKKVDEIVVVLPFQHAQKWEAKLKRRYKNLRVVAGGKQRQDSVKTGIDSLKNRKGIILVHDIARPFFTDAMVKRLTKGAKKYGACIPCVEMQDTVKEFDGNFVSRTPDRGKMVQIQTPQAFRAGILRNAYRKAYEEGFYGSDDAVLVERAGGKVYLAKGSRENIKMTYPSDILFAETLLKKGKKKWKKAE
ncbi:MAG: 2-C-methyl-D-erythritol 4-phosphate cytidylyltransferase [Candidatus Omnitrophica bacterium]|nr:2-C-methyl-D-erythritol 4-phosphate cytidylyltransferase [Candidatus Omnitrophota bacterium]